MTTSFLTLQGATFGWPGGRRLFSNLTLLIDRRHTDLVGRNGVGKSVLARVLAGELEPAAGRRTCTGRVHYVPQHVDCPPGTTVAAVADVQEVLDALERIEVGGTNSDDFTTVGEHWDTFIAMFCSSRPLPLAYQEAVTQFKLQAHYPTLLDFAGLS